MDRLLKDYLVEHTDETGTRLSLTCTLCGKTWMDRCRRLDKSGIYAARESAAKEAGKYSRICSFCGRVVCEDCHVNAEGIRLCVQCSSRLRAKLDGKEA